MSFYNVANPVNFATNDGNARRIAPLSTLKTIPATQHLTAPPTHVGLPFGQLSLSQVLSGYLVLSIPEGEGPYTIYLPRPQDLLAGLRNSALLENRTPVGLNDIIELDLMCFEAIIIASTSRTGVQNITSSSFSADNHYPQTLLIKFDNVTPGEENYIIMQ